MAHEVTLITGDGTGPELAEAARLCVDATGVKINWDVQEAGIDVMARTGTPLPDGVLASVRRTKCARKALDYARKHQRKKVAGVHQAHIMKYSDGLYLHTAQKVAKDYADIEFEERIVDNMCMQLVQKPELYDVLVLPNLYGDIVSDLAAGLVGGLGVAPGANIGADAAVFEPVHGSAPKYAGLDKANPTALILSGALMLRHLGYPQEAVRVETAVRDVIAEGRTVTYDLGGTTGTAAFGDAIIDRLAAAPAVR